MANLPETEEWIENLELIDATFPVLGGLPDVANKRGGPNINDQRLGARTRFLKAIVDQLVAQDFLTEPSGDLRYVRIGEEGGFITQAQLDAAVSVILNAPPSSLDTLNELAAALGDDPNFATTMTNLIAAKASTSYVNQQIATRTTSSAVTSLINNAINALKGGASSKGDTLGKLEDIALGGIGAILEDRKSSGSDGQVLGSSWNVRQLNTVFRNVDGLVSLSSNRFTVSEPCIVTWEAPARDTSQTRLYRVSGGVVVGYGTSNITPGGGIHWSTGCARISPGQQHEIRHRSSHAQPGGYGTGFGTEVFTRVKFQRVQ